MRTKISPILVITLLLSCGASDEKGISVNIKSDNPLCRVGGVLTDIDITSDEMRSIDFSSSPEIYDAQYIVLDTKGGYIAYNQAMEVWNSKIYILDNNTDKIFIYDMNGKNVKTIDSKGRGPQDYLGVMTMTFTDDKMLVPDCKSQQILVYDLNGEFLYKRTNPIQRVETCALNDSTLLNMCAYAQNIGTPIQRNSLQSRVTTQ